MFGYVCASFSAAPEYEEIDEDEAEGVEEEENLQDVPLEEEVQEETEDREAAEAGVADVTQGGEEGSLCCHYHPFKSPTICHPLFLLRLDSWLNFPCLVFRFPK